MAIQVYRKFDPDELAADGYIPKAPMCQRCGRVATYTNPVGVSFRKDWDGRDGDPNKFVDALCWTCREWLKVR